MAHPPERRRFFLPALSLGLILWVSAFSVSWAGPPSDNPQEDWTSRVSLNEEQKRELADLQRRFRQDLRGLSHQIMIKRLELRTLTREEFNGTRGAELRGELMDLFRTRRDRTLFYQEEAMKLLREEQRENLPPGSDLGFRCSPGWHRGGYGGGRRGGRMGPPAAEEKAFDKP